MVDLLENLILELGILIENSTHLIEDSALDFDSILLIFALLDGIIFGPLGSQFLLERYHLLIEILFNVSIVLEELLIDICIRTGHLPLVVLNHFFELVTELAVGLVESYLYSML